MLKSDKYQEIKSLIEKEGYILISTEYINNHSKLNAVCPNRHRCTISYKGFKRGYRCAECQGVKKKTIGEIQVFFEKEGYELVSAEYKNAFTKLAVICPKGHDYKICYNDFQQGRRCATCQGKKRDTLDEVRKFFEKEGYKLITNHYKEVKVVLHSICPKGHDHYANYGNFRKGQRCSECQGLRKKTMEKVRELFMEKGYRLISTEYKNSATNLQAMCSNGHLCFISYNHLSMGHGCMDCYGNRRKTIEEIRAVFEKEGYKLVSEKYENGKSTLHTLCPKGHDHHIKYGDFQQGKRCPICQNNGTSKPEQELTKILKNIFPDLIKKSFKVKIPGKPYIHRFQVDILDPETKLGIEYDGEYHHSEEYLIKSKTEIGWPIDDAINYHPIKDSALWDCHGIKLLHIKGEEWEKDKQVCINKCIKFLTSI